jgi:elongation factor 1-beta
VEQKLQDVKNVVPLVTLTNVNVDLKVLKLNGGITMGEVLTTMKIMPESPEEDLAAIKATIESSMPESAEIHEIAEEPIAFGLVAIILKFITEDGEGGSEPVEEMVSAIDGVASIEITGVGRLM